MRTRSAFLTIAVVLSFLSIHCGVTQPVRVLEEGQTQLTASLGGPFVTVKSTTFPVPYATLGVMHGVSERITLVGNLHATAALFRDGAFTHVVHLAGPSIHRAVPVLPCPRGTISWAFGRDGGLDLAQGERAGVHLVRIATH